MPEAAFPFSAFTARWGARAAGAWPWVLAWLALVLLDGALDVGNLAQLLVLAAAFCALWWPWWAALGASALSVLLFNYAFVPPRGTLSVELHQHALLLLSTLALSALVAVLMGRLRAVARQARWLAACSERQRLLAQQLRETEQAQAALALLAQALAPLGAGPVAALAADVDAATDPPTHTPGCWWGEVNEDEASGLRLCMRQGRSLGQGTGRHDNLWAVYWPLRARAHVMGAALLRLREGQPLGSAQLAHAQALCDEVGAALERLWAHRLAQTSRQQSQVHALRNTLLASIAHDHRTPLASIANAAELLRDQAPRLGAARCQQLAQTIVDEAAQLGRITDNSLQLARLDDPGRAVPMDWEAVEELVASAAARYRQRPGAARLRLRLPQALPLVRCNAVLVVQLLDNLLDNAARHGPRHPDGSIAPTELRVWVARGALWLQVCDRGPGLDAAVRAHWFEGAVQALQRPPSHGSGVGLALCHAIARAHGAALHYRARRGGGACFALGLPLSEPPAPPQEESEARP
ncbi:MAG: sensor histidine kinase [Rhodoferax sp.]